LLKNCSPNTYHTCWSDRRLLVKAARPIAEGEPITFCKVDNAKCNLFRRRLLEDALVDCQCPRCSDGTELGTGFSSLVCKSCTGSSHLISSTDPRFNHLLDLTHFTTQAILKIPFGQGWQKFQAPLGRLEVLWLQLNDKGFSLFRETGVT